MTTTCPHTVTEPVEVRDQRNGATRVVARICAACLDRLPAGWGCPRCDFTEIRSYGGDLIRTHVDPCKEHRG